MAREKTPGAAGRPRCEGPLRVLVGLGAPFLRLGVETTLKTADGCQVVGSVSRSGEVLRAVDRLRPDVVVFDADFQRDDPTLLAQLTSSHPGCGVLVLVNHSDEECVVRSLLAEPGAPRLSDDALARLGECCMLALRASARGCVPKSGEPARLLDAIRTVAAGDLAAGPWLEALIREPARRPLPTARASERISGREMDVIELVARGLENKEIARDLGIREQTVKNHLGSAMRKLGVRNRQEVAIFAVRLHFGRTS